MSNRMSNPAVAFLLVILAVVTPLVYASTTPTVTRECVALGNAFNLLPPSNPAAAVKSTLAARKAITKNWMAWVNANQTQLAGIQSQLLANRAAIVANDTDATPLYNALHSVGSNFTLAEVQKNFTSTSAQRERILDAIQSQGLGNTLGALTTNVNPFLANGGPQPADAGYCYLQAESLDLAALAAIIAPFNPEVAAIIAAIAALLFLYAEYVNCYFDPDDPGEFFTD